MNVARRVAIGAGSQIGVRVVLVVLGLATFALVARHLTIAEFGAYALVVAVVPLLAAVIDFGVGATAVREIARRPGETAAIVSTTLVIVAALAAAGALLALSVIPALPYGAPTREALAIAVAALFVLLLATVPGIVFQSAVRLELQAVVDLVGGVATFALVVLVVALDGGLQAIVAAWVAAAVLATVVAYVLALRLVAFRPRLRRPLARGLLRGALPIGLAFVASAIHFRIDTVLLSLLAPIEDVGIYGAAFRFLEHALFAPLFFMNALFPVLAGYVARHDPRLRATVRRAFSVLLLIAAPVAVGALVLAEPLIAFVVGPGFEEAALPLRILSAAVLLTFVNPLFTNMLVAGDLQSRMLVATVVGIVINVGLNLVLIPVWSYNGAAAATVASEAVAVGLAAVWAMRHAGTRLDWRPAARIALAAFAMGAVVAAAAGLPLAVPIALGAAVYGALVVALGVVDPAEVRALLRPAGAPGAMGASSDSTLR